MQTIQLISIQVGLPRQLGRPDSSDAMDAPWTSAFFKTPVAGVIRVGGLGLDGDGVADRTNHGGPDKAMLMYALANYTLWSRELAREDFVHGGFGENLTVDGIDESTTCVGDRYRIGSDVEIEVSQPRFPCWKLGRRWRMKDLPDRVMQNGRSGWYVRVISPGMIEARQPVALLDRPFPELTIRVLNDMVYGRAPVTEAAATCPRLFEGWRKRLSQIRERNTSAD